MLTTRRVAQLDTASASGLARVGDCWFVIADDQLELAMYEGAPGAARPAGHVPLFAGRAALPADPVARKRAKPDLEALAFVPGVGLVALGSGSTTARSAGTVLRFPDSLTEPLGFLAENCRNATPSRVDLGPLHGALRARFPELNLEGATAAGEGFFLLQRGNGGAGENGLVELSLAGVREALLAGRAWTPALVHAIRQVALGTLGGAPLGFTDASGLPDGRIVFAAAAEASGSTYDDGVVAGSVVGVMAVDGRILTQEPLDIVCKVEGVHATPAAGGGLDVYLVCDADDPAVPSPLLVTHLPA